MRVSRSSLRVVRLVLILLLGGAFAIFMTAVAFAPDLFAGPLIIGGTVSLWFLFGIGLIWSVVLTTGIYVMLANAADRA